jgi:hypothetical protein
MKIFSILLLALVLALPSWLAQTVTASGWGSSIAYEVWICFHAVLVLGLYFTTRNIFNVWGGALITAVYAVLFCVYTGITPIQVSLLDVGLGLLVGGVTYFAATAVQIVLVKTSSRESYSVLAAIVAAMLMAVMF